MSSQARGRIAACIDDLRPSAGVRGRFEAPRSLAERMASLHAPGVAIAVVEDFRLAWTHAQGLADIRSDRPVDGDTLFQAGSISKPIFVLGVLRAVQAGRLDLDEDVNRYLRAWKVPAHGAWQPSITLRQLLSHTAGLNVHGFPGYQASEPVPTILQILDGRPPANTPGIALNILPGLQTRYSGGGFTVAQQVMEDVLGKPFPQLMRELVLEPLGAFDSTYEQPLPAQLRRRAATAYPWKNNPVKGRFHTYPEMAAAGLWTTPADLARIGAGLQRILAGQVPAPFLAKEALEAMLAPQLDVQPSGADEYRALGFACGGEGDGAWFGHDGWNEGFVASMRFCRRTGQGAVVMVNANEGEPILDELMRAIAAACGWPEPSRRPAPTRPADLPYFTGRYETATGKVFEISLAGDRLMLRYDQQPPFPIEPVSSLAFAAPNLDMTLQFELSGETRLLSFTLTQEDTMIKAYRHVQ
ncbi:MAG TPA: serine hydrolase domain-containing protein [Holophaga sp.]|nr:serine hydrolase domain-containing protein [Holophaga sp.]